MAERLGGPWSANVSFGRDGMAVAGVSAVRLAEEFDTPLVVVDEDHLRERCRAFRASFPRVLWAVKAFPARALITIVAEEGLGLLAATGGEVDACLRAGVAASRIALHGNNKLDREIEEAVRARIGLVIVDHDEELDRVAAAARRAGVRQPVLLRLAPGIDVEAHDYVKTGAPDTKFGTPIAGGMALDLVRRAVELDALDVRGVHLHLGSQLLAATPYLAALELALDFLADARAATGLAASVLDLGGGMGATYTDEPAPDPSELGTQLREHLESRCRSRGVPVPELIVEPGRAITSGAACTLYRVGSIKEAPGLRTFVAVDGGMSDNVRPALYGARYTVALASRSSDAPGRQVTVVGRHCESGDVLARDVTLPADIGRGDLVALASTGAYEYAMASAYNKVGRPAVVLVREGRPRLAARRETYDDLSRLDVE